MLLDDFLEMKGALYRASLQRHGARFYDDAEAPSHAFSTAEVQEAFLCLRALRGRAHRDGRALTTAELMLDFVAVMHECPFRTQRIAEQAQQTLPCCLQPTATTTWRSKFGHSTNARMEVSPARIGGLPQPCSRPLQRISMRQHWKTKAKSATPPWSAG